MARKKKGSGPDFGYKERIRKRRDQSPSEVDWSLAVEGIDSAYDWIDDLLKKRQRAMAQVELLIDDIGSKKVDLKVARTRLQSILKTLD